MVTSKGDNGSASCSNPVSIMLEVACAAYLDEILFGKKDSKERFEITSFFELAQRVTAEELVAHVNKHLEMRMFLVGQNITVADIIVLLYIADYFKSLEDYQKMELCHTFRWLDHIQHLPGMLDQVTSLGLFINFPDETQTEPNKA